MPHDTRYYDPPDPPRIGHSLAARELLLLDRLMKRRFIFFENRPEVAALMLRGLVVVGELEHSGRRTVRITDAGRAAYEAALKGDR